MHINPKRRPRNPEPAPDIPDWITVGAPVAELEYLGRDRYHAVRTTVVRMTPRQVITGNGRRFWLSTLREVGYNEKQLTGIKSAPWIRLVRPDHPRIPGTADELDDRPAPIADNDPPF